MAEGSLGLELVGWVYMKVEEHAMPLDVGWVLSVVEPV